MEIIKRTGSLIIEALEVRVGNLHDELSLGARDRINFAANVMAEIAHMKLTGEDTSHHERSLLAIFANWEYEKASEISRAFWSAVDDVIGVTANAIGQFAAGALKAAI